MFLEQRVDNLVLNGVYFFQLLFFQSPIDERTCAQEPKVMKNIVAGNWKSNKLMNEALELMAGLKQRPSQHSCIRMSLIAPAIALFYPG